MLFFIISFIAGVLTVLAPCVLPLLPVIVGGSFSGEGINKKKTFTIVFSLGLSVILFTILLKASTVFIDIPESFWKWFSGGLIVFIGLAMFFPRLWENGFLAKLSAKSNILLGKGDQKKSFWGDVLVGSALGPVFSTCSPTYFILLATVLPANPTLGLFYLASYTVGLCLMLFIVALVGQKIMTSLGIAADPKGKLKKILGIIFILVGITVILGLDKKLQIYILDSGFFDVTKIEQKLLQYEDEKSEEYKNEEKKATSTFKNQEKVFKTSILGEKAPEAKYLTLAEKENKYKKSIEISTPDGFVNTQGKPITISELKEKKVILLDIWTYSCINCQRTLPFVNLWYEKYKDQGLEIIGLHTPEFSFEKVQSNVEDAVRKFKINYPVVLDNDFSTWNAYGNKFWPRKYLIDIDGFIVYDHIGEGNYKETEEAIQKALKERSTRLGVQAKLDSELVKDPIQVSGVKSAEVYFGAWRNEVLANGVIGKTGIQNFVFPQNFKTHFLYMDGSWDITSEYAESVGQTKVFFRYIAKNMYMVASSPTPMSVDIYQDGTFLKSITIQKDELYTLVQNDVSGEHSLEIRIPNAGLKAFTFTFG